MRAYRREWLLLPPLPRPWRRAAHVPAAPGHQRAGAPRPRRPRERTTPRDLFDRAVYGGRSYSDKAPGISFLAVPAYVLEHAAGADPRPRHWDSEGDLRLWVLRVASGGLLFLLGVFLVGRAAEGLAPGTGA